MKKLSIVINGLIKENPTFVLLLGMCPTLGTTSNALNGMSMGIATMAVLMMSNMVIAGIRNFIPDKVRIPAYIVVIASSRMTKMASRLPVIVRSPAMLMASSKVIWSLVMLYLPGVFTSPSTEK